MPRAWLGALTASTIASAARATAANFLARVSLFTATPHFLLPQRWDAIWSHGIHDASAATQRALLTVLHASPTSRCLVESCEKLGVAPQPRPGPLLKGVSQTP